MDTIVNKQRIGVVLTLATIAVASSQPFDFRNNRGTWVRQNLRIKLDSLGVGDKFDWSQE